jgi:hypothetical protein
MDWWRRWTEILYGLTLVHRVALVDFTLPVITDHVTCT